jgi:hypothetical protein
MTGTSLDLTPFGALLKGIGVIYWVLAPLRLTAPMATVRTVHVYSGDSGRTGADERLCSRP